MGKNRATNYKDWQIRARQSASASASDADIRVVPILMVTVGTLGNDMFAALVRSTTWQGRFPQTSAANIIAQCSDGHHQIGTTRIRVTGRWSGVDADCRVHGSANLFAVVARFSHVG